MRKRLQLKWMLTASTLLTTSFTLPGRARAAAGNDPTRGIATTEEQGRTICVNDDAPAKERPTCPRVMRGATLVDRRSKENRWKPVPSGNTESGKAPGSAPAGASEFDRRNSVQSANAKILQANSYRNQATPQAVDQSGVPPIAETQDDVRRIHF